MAAKPVGLRRTVAVCNIGMEMNLNLTECFAYSLSQSYSQAFKIDRKCE